MFLIILEADAQNCTTNCDFTLPGTFVYNYQSQINSATTICFPDNPNGYTIDYPINLSNKTLLFGNNVHLNINTQGSIILSNCTLKACNGNSMLWQGLFIEPNNNEVTIENCLFENAITGITITGANSIYITKSTFNKNKISMFLGLNNQVTVENCSFTCLNNQGYPTSLGFNYPQDNSEFGVMSVSNFAVQIIGDGNEYSEFNNIKRPIWAANNADLYCYFNRFTNVVDAPNSNFSSYPAIELYGVSPGSSAGSYTFSECEFGTLDNLIHSFGGISFYGQGATEESINIVANTFMRFQFKGIFITGVKKGIIKINANAFETYRGIAIDMNANEGLSAGFPTSSSIASNTFYPGSPGNSNITTIGIRIQEPINTASHKVRIKNNTMKAVCRGIDLNNVNRTEVTDNYISFVPILQGSFIINSGFGINAEYSRYLECSNNIIRSTNLNSDSACIKLYNSPFFVVNHNELLNCKIGLYLKRNCKNGNITCNIFKNCRLGIYMEKAINLGPVYGGDPLVAMQPSDNRWFDISQFDIYVVPVSTPVSWYLTHPILCPTPNVGLEYMPSVGGPGNNAINVIPICNASSTCNPPLYSPTYDTENSFIYRELLLKNTALGLDYYDTLDNADRFETWFNAWEIFQLNPQFINLGTDDSIYAALYNRISQTDVPMVYNWHQAALSNDTAQLRNQLKVNLTNNITIETYRQLFKIYDRLILSGDRQTCNPSDSIYLVATSVANDSIIGFARGMANAMLSLIQQPLRSGNRIDETVSANRYLPFELFPNPGNTYSTIRFSEPGIYKIRVLNMVGIEITIDKTTNRDVYQLNTLDWDNGIYFIECTNSVTGAQAVQKLVISH